MIIRMALAGADNEYTGRLVKGLEHYEELNLYVYTERKNLDNALKTKKIDILLFDASLYDGQFVLPSDTLGIALVDDSVSGVHPDERFPCVSKYQRVSRIYRQVLELYADVCGETGLVTGKSRMSILAFYSPIGGCGKTTVALASAVGLARQGHSTFYMNLEDIASESCYLPQSEGRGMSDILSCLGTETNFAVKLQGLLQNKVENLFYLNHFSTPNDIYEIKEEELEMLLDAIGNTGLFDYMVVDMGVALDRKAIRLFECSDRIILIEKPGAMASGKLACFYAQTHIMNEYAGKMLRVQNFRTGNNNIRQNNIPVAEVVDMLQNPEDVQLIEMLSERGINSLLDCLLYG